jgi:surface-anchored protein
VAEDPAVVWLGLGAPTLGRGIFAGGLSNRGRLSMRLEDVRGSGVEAGGGMVLYQSGFPPRVWFSSLDGLDGSDEVDGLSANFHAHYNWAFTAPGVYRATFAYRGTLLEEHGGGEVRTTVEYLFDVGGTGERELLRYAEATGGGWLRCEWLGEVYPDVSGWLYVIGHGWLLPVAGGMDGFWFRHPEQGWLWSHWRAFPRVWSPADPGGWREI